VSSGRCESDGDAEFDGDANLMATPILYLDADDEITSAAARIRSTDADRLALVLPYGSRLATSRINFRLLAREAAERGKTIEIVAADSSARALAAAAGLTVHPSVAAFEVAGNGAAGGATTGEAAGRATPGAGAAAAATAVVIPERGNVVRIDPPGSDDAPTGVIIVPRRGAERVPVVGRVKPPVRTGVAVGLGVGILALVVVGGILAFLLLPSATIVLAPRSTEVGPLADSVEARPDVTAPDATTMQIPSKPYPFGAEASGTFTTAGKKVTDTAGTGNVTFANFDTGGGNTIPAGAIVKTESGIAFRTLESANLPPASISFFPPFPVSPSTATVPVVAVVSGESGNVPANTIVVVPKGENKNLTKVTNQDPTSGGSHTESPQVSQADVNKAMATLNTQLAADFDTKVQAAVGVPAGTTLFPETKSLGAATPSVDPKTLVGQLVPTFDLALTAAGTVVGVDASPVKTVAEARLRSRVDAGSTLDPASITIDIGTPAVTGDTVTFPVTMHGTEVRSVDKASLLAAIRGLDLPAARAKLQPFGDATISVWPDWVTSVPTNADRVSLTIGSPAPAPTPAPTP
jgi:baseplate J-like protein